MMSAYDVSFDSGRAVLLWSTRIGCPARGYWLPDALPSALVMASPYIGRETAKPQWVRATERFKPEVILGDARLVQ